MNGWGEGHPAWWLNLQAQPDAVVRLAWIPDFTQLGSVIGTRRSPDPCQTV